MPSSMIKSDLAAPSPPKFAPASSASPSSPRPSTSATSSRARASGPVFELRELDPDGDTEMEKDLDTEPEPVRVNKPDAAPKKKEKAPRKSTKGRASDIREAEAPPKKSRRSSSKKDKESTTARPPSKRQANGLPKPKTWSNEMEKKIQNAETQIANDVANLNPDEFDEEQYKSQARKRRRIMADKDAELNFRRRDEYVQTSGKRLADHAELGKRRYDDVFYDEALREVRDQELFAEKERKKDMQRKRRREKSMAVTIEQKEAALARAEAAEDEAERQKHLRDAERANKKAQQTKLILQKGIKGPARNVELNLNSEGGGGGGLSSLQASDVETPKPTKSKRSGNRPKKSKEQKQAEKDSAEAAQAALDAGEELPSKEEGRVRIKIKNKSKTDAEKPVKEKPVKEKPVKEKPVKEKPVKEKPVKEKQAKEKQAKEKQVKEKSDAAKEKEKDKDKEKEKDKDKDKEKEKVKEKEKEKEKEKVEEVPEPEKKFVSKGYNQIYDQIWRDMARKDVSKTFKLASDSFATKGSNLKKTAILASKEAKRWQLRTNKGTKDLQARAKRVMRDMMGFWKRNEREERDLRKAAEKQEIENARKEEADREAARQKRKLNFLISQTELYSHFIGKKIKTDEVERSTDNPDIAPDASQTMQNTLSVTEPTGPLGSKVTHFANLDFDDEDETALQAAAMANAQNAIAEAQKKAREFNQQGLDMDEEGEMNFQNPTGLGDVEIEQPKLINAQLKEYQLKGLNWLVNLYEQGINGILADEMGLGKTVQSISVMAYLAEKHDIWGPFLVVAPASTLHNWQQEIAKFVPEFKILPYWGSAGDRKVLRKFWDRKHTTYKKDAPFHVCVTSYQLVVSDVAYFQKMRWQYMILDEAQAIKSSQSSRWKCLLGFHCRNRLLLTGTPIQNNMQELWALLHFIMPSLFDSHDEFSEWFSKDIESHAQSNTKLNEDQLKRLHMILKPFMLRRVKKHVQKELGDKIELDVFCNLTYRQRAFYSNLRNQINIMDLVEKATMGDDQDSGTLMNLVMQFRKVCNHPDLFERAEVTSPYSFGYFAETASFVREGSQVAVGYSAQSLITYRLPALIWTEGGRLDRPGGDNDRAGWRNKALSHMMNIWDPENVETSSDENKAFSWLRFADVTPGEVHKTAHSGLFDRAVAELQKRDRLGLIREAYDEPEDRNFTPAHCLLKIRERDDILAPSRKTSGGGVLEALMNVASLKFRDSGLGRLEMAARPRASAPPIEVACNKPSSVLEREKIMFNSHMRKMLYGPTVFEERALVEKKVPLELYPVNKLLPAPDQEKRRFTNITVPSMQRFVTDSGKLAKLDELLFKLKNEGHRVLLYFQMTRMIDMMEDYLTYRNYKYCRLDGSTKLEDRRDTVHDFQTRPEIFIFLLSTRAGGLGINLTSADTVIFYDSDWNPTIDSQAMDRAHRLGQTRQVTVYRLITRGTIEERIRKRALQKEEVQRVVIQGGGASVDFSGRRAPENRNRDIAMWLADDEQAELIERRERELLESGEYEKQKKRGGKRKKVDAPASLDDMYHEGEGNFDDGSKAMVSGTATPAEPEPKGKKGRAKSTGKRAKTTKQRLAIADGFVDA
ncbi:putative DNA helicase [Escovopsis weberi]|uniref:Chromatin-remodeling ATPase INO80 n=1 Tax=Escovopsis weberi TaxID=150374 RepID=A0A0M8N1D2_ESCWE|nr:putative DNA helicase [Escovopsis weberi]